MGHKPTEDTAELQKQNLKAFSAWLKTYGKSVMPIPGKSVTYGGFPEADLRKARQVLGADKDLKGIWAIIEKTEANLRAITGVVEFDLLSDVLKRLKSPLPKLFEATGANIGHPKKFVNMYDCADALASDSWQLLDRGMRKAVWQALSKLYVENSTGEMQIWEGRKMNYKTLDRGCILINTELEAIIKNKKLSPKVRKEAQDIVKRYESFHSGQNKKLEEMFNTAEANIEKGAKR